jgi:hypothetical protein
LNHLGSEILRRATKSLEAILGRALGEPKVRDFYAHFSAVGVRIPRAHVEQNVLRLRGGEQEGPAKKDRANIKKEHGQA